jgi:hypothetical protein
MPEEPLKRISGGSVTETLITATERADEMSHVLILWEGKDGDPGGVTSDDTMDVKLANYLANQLIAWLHRHVKEFD